MHSDRPFIGNEEAEEIEENNLEAINDVSLFDISLTYAFTERLSLTASLPYLIAEREQPIGAEGDRNDTTSHGIGDLILVPRFWLLDTKKHTSGNVSIGLGAKIPTGVDNATDVFIVRGPTGESRQVRTVDQSIQPGDGGWGVVVSLNSFKRLGDFVLYGTGTYLLNPRNTNHVQTFRLLPGEEVMSVADQYQARLGASWTLPWVSGFAVSLGGRIDGVPPRDLLGESDGFRRPGFAVSVEPGIAFATGKHTFSLSVPVAVYRERQQSVPEEENDFHGDASFADFLIIASWSVRFGGEDPASPPPFTAPLRP
jgi:hypothetical protein